MIASSLDETIVALATPTGTSAIALIRASGRLCEEWARTIFGAPLPARRAVHAPYVNCEGEVLDDVVAVFFAGPKSYTGEATLEVNCHGNPYIVRRIMDDLCARGARMAQAGEFTQRAYFNRRLDLSQAEAVMDVIQAQSARALAVAQQQLRGSLGRHMERLNGGLLDALAQIEAYIDFPDEDLPAEDQGRVLSILDTALGGVRQLLATRRYGEVLRGGLRTVILGAPNAGKSSLLNRLVGFDRALVSPEPGTTRDFIEEVINVGSHALRLVDTAGLNAAPAEIERRGMVKTIERLAEADLILWVIDAAAPADIGAAAAETLREHLHRDSTRVIRVLNKQDLVAERPPEPPLLIAGVPYPVVTIRFSAMSGEGMGELMKAIDEAAGSFQVASGDEVLAVNARHAAALDRAVEALTAAKAKLTAGSQVAVQTELLASDIRESLEALGEIVGRFDNERMLDRLFSTFCIGK